MGLEIVKQGKLLYHLTKLKNLPSIIEHGLLSRADLEKQSLQFADVANHDILEGRKTMNLENYVPFHFHPYSAFDIAVQNKYLSDAMIYICIKREYAKEHNFKILPCHPLSAKDNDIILYDYEEGFKIINWDIMAEVGSKAENAKNIKMAECLSDSVIPFSDFHCITVSDEKYKNGIIKVLNKIGQTFNPPYIDVQERWFDIQ